MILIIGIMLFGSFNVGLTNINASNDPVNDQNIFPGSIRSITRGVKKIDWSQIEVLSEPIKGQNSNLGSSTWVEIAVENDKIYAVWWDSSNLYGSGSDSDIFYRYFDGFTWSDIQVISEPELGKNINTDQSRLPSIAVENGNIYVIWEDRTDMNGAGTDQDVFFRCNLTGQGWEPIQVISEPVFGQNYNTGLTYSSYDIEVKNGKIYVAWGDNNETNNAGSDYDILYRCNLTGTSWEPIQVISEPVMGSDNNIGTSVRPNIAVENTMVYIVWDDMDDINSAGTDMDVFYRESNGTIWSEIQVISEPVPNQDFNTGQSWRPIINVENNKLYVVWYDSNDTYSAGKDNDIFYRCNLTGDRWEPVQVLSEPVFGQDINTGGSAAAQMVTENGNIYVAWFDSNNTNGSGTDFDIFFTCNLTGDGWEPIQVISEEIEGLDNNVEFSSSPSIAVEDGNIYVAWDDENDTYGAGTDSDIFFRSLYKLDLGPKIVHSVKAYSDDTYSNEITYAEVGDTVYVELLGVDEDPNGRNRSIVNLTSSLSAPFGIWLHLMETGLNTGVFRGNFKISDWTHSGLKFIKATIGENITISAVTDPTKNAIVLVSTPIQLRPLQDKTTAIEDFYYYVHYWNFGYNPVSSWIFDTNAPWLSWDEINHDVYGTPNNGYVGIFWVRINIIDGLGNYDEHNFNIKVQNTPPNITNEDILDSYEDEIYYADYNSSDDGNGTITWHLETNASWLSLGPFYGVLSGTPTNSDRGTYWVNVSVDDGNNGWDWSFFEITVFDTNDPPKIITENVTTAFEDELYWIEYYASDIDGEINFRWSLYSNATWLGIDNLTGVLSGTPNNSHVGAYSVNVTVMDPRGGQDHQEFILEVFNVNDAPEWSRVPKDTVVNEGEVFTFDVNASDVDVGDILKFNLTAQTNTNITIDSRTGKIEWRANIKLSMETNYTIEITLYVTDGKVTIRAYFNITVIMNPQPITKLISPINNSRVSVLGTELKWRGSDIGNDSLTYILYLSKDRSAVISLSQSQRIINNINLTSYVADGLNIGGIYYWTVVPVDRFRPGKCCDDYFVFEINNPPTISSISLQKATVGKKFKYELQCQDLNSEDIRNLNFSLESAPKGMSIDPLTGMINWTPSEAQVGEHRVTVQVSDGIDQANISFVIQTSEKGKPTVWSNIIIITGVSFLILLVALGSFIGGTELGKYKFMSVFVVPLYYKLQPDKVLDNYTRGQIHGFIKAKPGEHYNAIKDALDLKNGILSYHLRILEKEGFVKSKHDGFHTKFYPIGMKVSEPIPFLQTLIYIIETQPGITQHEIISMVDSSQQTLSYNLTQLIRNDMITMERNGRENRYYINQDTVKFYQDYNQDQIQNSVQFKQIKSINDPQRNR